MVTVAGIPTESTATTGDAIPIWPLESDPYKIARAQPPAAPASKLQICPWIDRPGARSTAASTRRRPNPEKLEIVARRNGFARWLAKPPKKFEVPHARLVPKPNPVAGRLDIFHQLAVQTILHKLPRNSASEFNPALP